MKITTTLSLSPNMDLLTLLMTHTTSRKHLPHYLGLTHFHADSCSPYFCSRVSETPTQSLVSSTRAGLSATISKVLTYQLTAKSLCRSIVSLQLINTLALELVSSTRVRAKCARNILVRCIKAP